MFTSVEQCGLALVVPLATIWATPVIGQPQQPHRHTSAPPAKQAAVAPAGGQTAQQLPYFRVVVPSSNQGSGYGGSTGTNSGRPAEMANESGRPRTQSGLGPRTQALKTMLTAS